MAEERTNGIGGKFPSTNTGQTERKCSLSPSLAFSFSLAKFSSVSACVCPAASLVQSNPRLNASHYRIRAPLFVVDISAAQTSCTTLRICGTRCRKPQDPLGPNKFKFPALRSLHRRITGSRSTRDKEQRQRGQTDTD